MATAKSVVDVILGEAKAGNFQDMLAIASVIANRAAATGVTPQQVISAPGEFGAYGKSLPAGNDKFRDLAQQAIEYVAQNGPVHSGQFYATPSAAKNLPKGLSFETETDGHKFYSDPKGRSINTSLGYMPTKGTAPAQQAIENVAGRGLGLLSIAPSFNPDARETMPRSSAGLLSKADPNTALEDRQLSPVIDVAQYNSRAGRSMMPSSNIVDDVQMAVTKNFGPQYSVGIWSGQEPPGRAPVNSARNHPGGWAVDFDVIGPDGKSRLDMSNPVHAAALTQVQRDLAAKGHAIGYGEGYMAPGRTHAGSPPGSPVVGWGKTQSAGSMDPGLYSQLALAKETGFNLPDQGPVPTSRPATNIAGDPADTLYSPTVANTSLPPDERSAPEYASREGILGGLPAQQPSPATYRDGVLAGLPQNTPADVPSKASVPTYDSLMEKQQAPVDLASQYGLLSNSMKASGLLGLDGRQGVMAAPVDAAVKAPAVATNPVPTLAPPVNVRSIPQPVMAQPISAPQTFQRSSPMGTGLDVWGGRANVGIATNGDRLTRNDDGTITRDSAKYGWTQQMDPQGNIIGGSGAKNPIGALMGPFGGIISDSPSNGSKNNSFDFGHMARGALGGVAGGMVGGLLGPLGGILGSLLGAQIAQGKSPLGGLLGNQMTPGRNQQATTQPGLGFPSAPEAPQNPGDGSLTGFGKDALSGMYGQQAQYAAENPGTGLW